MYDTYAHIIGDFGRANVPIILDTRRELDPPLLEPIHDLTATAKLCYIHFLELGSRRVTVESLESVLFFCADSLWVSSRNLHSKRMKKVEHVRSKR